MLLNWLLNIHICVHIMALFSTLIWEISFCSEQWLIWSLTCESTWNVKPVGPSLRNKDQRMRSFLWKLPLGMHGHYTHGHIGSMAICTRQACQNFNTDDCGGSSEALALAENLLTVNGCWGKRAIFSVLKIKTPSLHQNVHSYISQLLQKKTGV